MAIQTGSTNLPAPGGDTPAISTAALTQIRASIEPRTGWWQFELRPWHYWVAIASTVTVTAAFILLALTAEGLHR